MAVMSREDEADEERWIRYSSAPLMVTLVLPIVIGVIILLKCVFHHCCIRKTTSKDEMYGVEGRMTMLATADSNFATTLLPSNGSNSITTGAPRPSTSHSLPFVSSDSEGISLNVEQYNRDREVTIREDNPKVVSAGPSTSGDTNKAGPSLFEDGVQKRFSGSGGAQLKLPTTSDSCESSGTLKRAIAQHRQLPDLPPTPHGVSRLSQPPRRSSSVLSNDGTSELYATVGVANGGGGDQPASSVPNRTRGNEATPSSDSETYAGSSSHHPYAKLKKSAAEHPYARVRGNPSSANNNDEETDTDNYDLPQFLNSSRPVGSASGNIQSPSSSSSSANRPLPASGVPPGAEGNGSRSAIDAEGPVPPRRVGREWRRPGPNQPPLNDMQVHFSGDSQDSRGYTSISVREPLSNIRNEVTATGRSFDSHYATVSDDSEEMYAAIDDPNDANYMRIGDRQRDNNSRPAWHGGPNVSSPIPERREANSPLPPVPNVPPPDISPGTSTSSAIPPPPVSPHSQIPAAPAASTLPVYAQVSKKTKKQHQKAPVTSTLSNTSTTSSQQTVREASGGAVVGGGGDVAILREGSSTTSHHHSHHRSKRAASLMDNSNTMDAESLDTRRWSKADISYSEFEVVRENVFLPPGNAVVDVPRKSPGSCVSDVCDSSTSRPHDLLDEDNYNIIPDKRTDTRSSQRHTPTSPLPNVQRDLDSGNYHEIEPKNLNNTYQEIGGGKEPSDHYQEIGRDGSELYQEIDRKDRNTDYEDDDEDEEDQFYERVKKPGSEAKKKHGYEKIKKKGSPSVPSEPTTSSRHFPPPKPAVDDDDDEDDKPDEMYECVKYPPYERLKEMEEDMESEDGKGSNYYEDIGYSRVKHKPKQKTSKENEGTESKAKEENHTGHLPIPVQDVHQLYAQIDKTKKRKGNTGSTTSANTTVAAPTVVSNIIKVEDIRVNNNEPNLMIPSISGSNNDDARVLAKVVNSSKNRNTEQGHYKDGAVAGMQNRANDNSIEYI